MHRLPTLTTRLHHPRPLSAGAGRSVLEGIAGCAVFFLFAAWLRPLHQVEFAAAFFRTWGGLWLTFWPAWRLAPIAGRRLASRAFRGIVRLVVLGIILG